MSEWSGINDEYEIPMSDGFMDKIVVGQITADRLYVDEKWVQCGLHMWYLQGPIDSVKADRLMKERLWETHGRKGIRKLYGTH